jgi:lipopolysaccharide/colanic/teichoic acid biosynthesis glycosyltransferase
VKLSENVKGLSPGQRFAKRAFDIFGAGFGLAATYWIILPAWVLASLDTRKNGFFTQERVGREGMIFRVIKVRTMRDVPGINSTVTTGKDQRITSLGRFWRKSKIDELPQLINVLKGDMSFVGPRPDVPGYADRLEGNDRVVLSVRPGITGPATLKYRDEEALLAEQNDPQKYNDEVLWLDKVRLNREYVENWSFLGDLRYIWETVFGKGKGERAKGRGKRSVGSS